MPEALRAVNWLFERGFLLDRPGPSEHRVEDPHPEAGPPPRSLEFWIHITNNCNLACQYCFVAGKNLQRMSDCVIEQTVKRIGYTARKYYLEKIILKFAGGEPILAVPSIERFLDLLSEEMAGLSIEVEPCIITNGTVFNDRLARLLRRTRCSVNISLDGYGPYHDIYRVYKGKGGGSWRRSTETSLRFWQRTSSSTSTRRSARSAPACPISCAGPWLSGASVTYA